MDARPVIPAPLVVSAGDLAGLVACAVAFEEHAAQRAGPAPVVRPFVTSGPEADARRQAARAQAEHYGLAFEDAPACDGWSVGALAAGLLSAGESARRHARPRVVWGVHAGVDTDPEGVALDACGRTLDLCLLVSRLLNLDPAARAVDVEAPLADLSDRQLADLGVDLGVPVARCCWWWGGGGSAPLDERGDAVRRAEESRWLGVLKGVGWGGPATVVVRPGDRAGAPR